MHSVYTARNGNTYDTRKAPPGLCFNCQGRHWRKDCPHRNPDAVTYIHRSTFVPGGACGAGFSTEEDEISMRMTFLDIQQTNSEELEDPNTSDNQSDSEETAPDSGPNSDNASDFECNSEKEAKTAALGDSALDSNSNSISNSEETAPDSGPNSENASDSECNSGKEAF
eukprot:Awhi_evm1s3146